MCDKLKCNFHRWNFCRRGAGGGAVAVKEPPRAPDES